MSEFNPKEIMFATTTQCNLHCAHCFVERRNERISIQKAKKLIASATPQIERIGFTGGEPFLYPEFIEEITKTAIENNLIFDRIMTNGVWWSDKQNLQSTLQRIYNAGYDGKFGVSFDAFHNQNVNKLSMFFNTVYEIWQDGTAIEIQSVIPAKQTKDYVAPINSTPQSSDKAFLQKLLELSKALHTKMRKNVDKNSIGIITIKNDTIFIPVYRFAPSLTSDNSKNWNSKKWFKDDFCDGPGHVLYVHSNENIAPCCGFANENNALAIGTIENSVAELMENSKKNKMVQICYKTGLEQTRIEMEKTGKTFPGITNDNCLFCDYLCKNKFVN